MAPETRILDTQLSDLEPGIRMIETAYTNNLKLVLKDGFHKKSGMELLLSGERLKSF